MVYSLAMSVNYMYRNMVNSPTTVLSRKSLTQNICSPHLPTVQAWAKAISYVQSQGEGYFWGDMVYKSVSESAGSILSFDLGSNYLGVFSL